MSLGHKRHRDPNRITNQWPLSQARLCGIGGHGQRVLEGWRNLQVGASAFVCPTSPALSARRKCLSAPGTEGPPHGGADHHGPVSGASLLSYSFCSETRQWQPKLRGLKTFCAPCRRTG